VSVSELKVSGFRVYYGEHDGGIDRVVADCQISRIRRIRTRHEDYVEGDPLHMGQDDFRESAQNASLFAAAPKLYRALLTLVEAHDQVPAIITREEWDEARKALASVLNPVFGLSPHAVKDR
jgi:hypothetical protein